MNSWRRRNPDKVKAQNHRAKANMRKKKLKGLYAKGIRIIKKWKIICPRCNHLFKTKAKRPQCLQCGYTFPRKYIRDFVDTLPTKKCTCCEREIPYQGSGTIKKYCDSCFPQIQALRQMLDKNNAENKRKEAYNRWKDKQEIVVAVTCIFCDTIIPGHRGKVICATCKSKWQRRVPRTVLDDERLWNSFEQVPLTLLVWQRIIRYREKGIYSL
jgi:Zn finger protein HypA/HybF involved in hydrogenase expression